MSARLFKVQDRYGKREYLLPEASIFCIELHKGEANFFVSREEWQEGEPSFTAVRERAVFDAGVSDYG